MEKLTVIKIGGNVIDDPGNLEIFLKDFAAIDGYKILIHGGGKIASKLSSDLGIEAKLVEGRRITDSESLKVVTMVYAGLINKTIVAQLQASGCNAIGLCGADGNLIKGSKRPVQTIDYGFVGDIADNSIDSTQLQNILESGLTPVFSAIIHDGKGQLLNTNADTIASAIAVAMCNLYKTKLVYCFEKKGVLRNVSDENSVIPEIDAQNYSTLKSSGAINSGMIPKMDNAFKAISKGVTSVLIGDSKQVSELNSTGNFGTQLIA